MQRFEKYATAVVLALASLCAHAQDKGYWKASSKTAKSITGDISFSGEKLILNFSGFTIAPVRTVTAAEVLSVFDSSDAAATGTLYRLSIPADRRFLHKNTLCGAEETQYLLTSVDGKTLQAAFFSGAKMPDLSREAVIASTTLCGTYQYVR